MSKFKIGDKVRIVGDWATVRKDTCIPSSEPEGTGHVVTHLHLDQVFVYAAGWRNAWYFNPEHLAHIDAPDEQAPEPDESDEPKMTVTRRTCVSIDGYGDVYINDDGDVQLEAEYIEPKHARAVVKAILICMEDEHE